MPSGEPATVPAGLSVFPVNGLGEVRPGDDLAELLASALTGQRPTRSSVPGGLADGDVVVVTQKVVSKAEGRIVADRQPTTPTPSGPWSSTRRCGSSAGGATW